MVLKKSSLLGRKEFLINCQKCTRTCEVTPDKIDNSDQICKIFGMAGFYIYQCKCGARFNVQFDFRNKRRHARELGCFYTTLTKKNSVQQLGLTDQPYATSINSVIKNISADGIGFSTNDRHDIKPGDELLIKFTIRRGARVSLVERRVIVRTVSSHNIGAEFFANDKKDPEIGFYLMDN